MKPFEYYEPETLVEACDMLARMGDEARLIAGGTDLLVSMKRRSITPRYIIAMSGISGLGKIEATASGLRVGALTSLRDLETAPVLRERATVIADAAREVGSQAIRNMATVGGNLCTAAPSADMAPPLIALAASARCVAPQGERTISLDLFFTGPGQTRLARGEILTSIDVPEPLPGTHACFLKARRTAVDIAIASVAVVGLLDRPKGRLTGVRIVLGAVGPTPMRSHRAESAAEGADMSTDGWINEASRAAAADAQPISDVRGSAEYRRAMVRVLVRDALRKIIERAGRDGKP